MDSVTVQRKLLVYGKHVVGDLYECNKDKLTDLIFLINTVREAAKIGNMILLEIKSWKIGLGVSIIGIVLESHISIHTWPEYSFATVDVYTCGKYSDPEKAFDYIVEKLEAKRINKRVFLRNYEVLF
ncbi:MAG: adenosylmethionine decarboxylase [Desulfurococcaceae archaeon]|jgi:S-adenosylmethionine decarboxylase|nr:adenosylmethionine decarboxylase [Desulfurococcaceae archaeon]MCC6058201.1 adenosylmethionine decarboxylase [Desulfurococcaceae archaeon]